VDINSHGQIYWDGRYKGDLDGIYIRNTHHEIVAKYVCNHVWLWSGDHYVDVGHAKNAHDAVYRICTQYRAMGNW